MPAEVLQRGTPTDRKLTAPNLAPNTLPAGTATGDLLILIATWSSNTAELTGPESEGWTAFTNGNIHSGERTTRAWWRLASPSLGNTPLVKSTVEAIAEVTVMAFQSGTFNEGAPINAQNEWTTSATGGTIPEEKTTPGLTTSVIGCRAVVVLASGLVITITTAAKTAGWLAEVEGVPSNYIFDKPTESGTTIAALAWKRGAINKPVAAFMFAIAPSGTLLPMMV